MFKAKEVKYMDSGKNVREAVIRYSDTLYKICIVILCNEQDVQDAIQDTFAVIWKRGRNFVMRSMKKLG